MKKKILSSITASALCCCSNGFCMERNELDVADKALRNINELFRSSNFADKSDFTENYERERKSNPLTAGKKKEKDNDIEKIQKMKNELKKEVQELVFKFYALEQNNNCKYKSELFNALEKENNFRKLLNVKKGWEKKVEIRKLIEDFYNYKIDNDDMYEAFRALGDQKDDIEKLQEIKELWERKMEILKLVLKSYSYKLIGRNELNKTLDAVGKEKDADVLQRTKESYEIWTIPQNAQVIKFLLVKRDYNIIKNSNNGKDWF